LNFILDERGRELHWEGHRRTDLIVLEISGGSYLWPWKKWLEDLQHLQRFIPNSCNTASNSKLIQNPGY
jgi:hypothetical protein